jgi:hypothetical protein
MGCWNEEDCQNKAEDKVKAEMRIYNFRGGGTRPGLLRNMQRIEKEAKVQMVSLNAMQCKDTFEDLFYDK